MLFLAILAMGQTGVNLMSFSGSNGNDCTRLHMGFICSLKSAGKQHSHKTGTEVTRDCMLLRHDLVNSTQLNPVMFQVRTLEGVLELE